MFFPLLILAALFGVAASVCAACVALSARRPAPLDDDCPFAG